MRDRKGIEFHKGDLVRSYHFTGARRKVHYLYHTVVDEGGVLYLVPTAHLEPTLAKGGGKCQLRAMGPSFDGEIIAGHGPENVISYEDRPREKPSKG